MGSKEIEELKILEDIEHTLKLYDLDQLDTVTEVTEGVDLVSKLSQNYRHLLVEIKITDEENYINNKAKCKIQTDRLDNYIKNARKKSKGNTVIRSQ